MEALEAEMSATDAYPGYFSLTLDNDIKMEATSTRRAGIERFTFPGGSKPYFVLDLANDLPASFAGGTLDIDPENGRITIGGQYGSRWALNVLCVSDVVNQLDCALASVPARTTTRHLLVMIS